MIKAQLLLNKSKKDKHKYNLDLYGDPLAPYYKKFKCKNIKNAD